MKYCLRVSDGSVRVSDGGVRLSDGEREGVRWECESVGSLELSQAV